jgi:hypothetical protein
VSTCRLARRVALTPCPQNPCLGAVDDPDLARNVLTYPCQPFLPERAGRWVLSDDVTVVARPSVRGRSYGDCGGVRRVEWRGASLVTPAITPALATKEKKIGGAS